MHFSLELEWAGSEKENRNAEYKIVLYHLRAVFIRKVGKYFIQKFIFSFSEDHYAEQPVPVENTPSKALISRFCWEIISTSHGASDSLSFVECVFMLFTSYSAHTMKDEKTVIKHWKLYASVTITLETVDNGNDEDSIASKALLFNVHVYPFRA